MIPVRLSIQGVFSYIEKQEIDFTGLTEAGLFGIFGKVGSGKSSIVDAITYVLYSNNFRLISSGMLYNMMNLASQSMHIEYDFRVGDALYRFSVSARRKRSNFEEVSPATRSACVWDTHQQDWVPIENNAAIIIGLSYEDFKRAVIIPQNNFQEFLELRSAERTQMMQKIFRLDKFDLSDRIRPLRDENNAQLSVNSTQLSDLGDLNPQQIELLETELKDLELQIKIREDQLKSLQLESAEWSKLKKQTEELFLKTKKLGLLKEKEEEYMGRKATLQAYRKAYMYIKPEIDRREEMIARISKLETGIRSTEEQRKKQEELHKDIGIRHDKARAGFETRDDLKKKSEDLEKLLKIRLAEAEIEKLISGKIKGDGLIRDLMESIERGRKALSKLQSDLAELKRNEIDIATVSNVLNWFERVEATNAQILEEEARLKTLQHSTAATLMKKVHLNKGLLTGIVSESTADFIEQEIFAVRQKLENDLKSVRDDMQKISQKILLQEHILALHDGEPCPLCGSAEHPDQLKPDAELQKMSDRLSTDANMLELSLKELDRTKDEWTNLKYEISKNDAFINESLARLAQLRKQAVDEKSKFIWNAFSDSDRTAATRAHDEYQRQAEQKKKLDTEIITLSQTLDHDSKTLTQYQNRMQEISLEISGHVGTIKANSQSMASPPECYLNEPTESLETQSALLMNEYHSAATRYESIREELNKSSLILAELKTRYESDMQSNVDLQQKLQSILRELQRVITECGFNDLEKVRLLLDSGIDADDLQQEIDTYFQSLHQAQTEYETASIELSGKNYDEARHRDLEGRIQVLQAELDINKKSSGALETEIKRNKSNLERQTVLLEQKVKLELRAANIQTLESLFKGRAFVNYASGVYLLNLVNIANVRFRKMTQGQLLLQLDKDNGFEVLDLLNDGKTRSVRTLSGGQKFQAALCLALALADGISQGNHENFFFLDEGFGSLDKESMQVVFETLQALRKENRVVGLISHVEEMQQEMNSYILVHRDEKRGSWLEVN